MIDLKRVHECDGTIGEIEKLIDLQKVHKFVKKLMNLTKNVQEFKKINLFEKHSQIWLKQFMNLIFYKIEQNPFI